MKHPLSKAHQIEEEKPEDVLGIRNVNQNAFKNSGEADIIDLLRSNCPVFISLVAKSRENVIGHILFTPVQIITSNNETITGMGLAPLAVSPKYRGQGIGSKLCRRGIQKIAALGYPFLVVLGHPGFYTRFGFTSAKQRGITCEYQDVPDDAFMIKVIDAEMMQDVIGTANYRPEFGEIT